MKPKKKIAPARIYLQRRLYDFEPDHCSSITWCDDQIDKTDVEYVRADIFKREQRRLKKQIEAWKSLVEARPSSGYPGTVLHAFERASLCGEARSSCALDGETQCEEDGGDYE